MRHNFTRQEDDILFILGHRGRRQVWRRIEKRPSPRVTTGRERAVDAIDTASDNT